VNVAAVVDRRLREDLVGELVHRGPADAAADGGDDLGPRGLRR
jgi:hypothetical protein